MSEFSDQLNQLIEDCHKAATVSHDQLYALERAFEAEDEMIVRHIDDVIARAEDRRRAMFGRLTTIANMMGIVPARAVPPPIAQMQVNDNMHMPRIVQPPPVPHQQPNPHWPIEQHANDVFDAFNPPRQAAGGR